MLGLPHFHLHEGVLPLYVEGRVENARCPRPGEPDARGARHGGREGDLGILALRDDDADRHQGSDMRSNH